MVTTCKVAQTEIEGFLVIKAPKKQKKEVTINEKRRRWLITLSWRNIPMALMRLNASMSMNQSRLSFQITSLLEINMFKG